MADMQVGNLHAADLAIIVVYLLASLLLGMYTILKTKGSIEGVFLAGRSVTWWPIGLSLFASNIGSVNFVGIAGDAAASGLAVVMFEWNAVFLLILLGWIFLPVYIASGIYTMPEYLAHRFGGKRLRIYLSVVALMTYIFATVSADLYSGALFMNQSLNINLYAAVAILLLIGLIFTGLGGLETVIITDSLAVIVMIIGGVILCGLGFAEVGGMESLKYKYMRAAPNTSIYTNSTCGYPRDDSFHIFRHPWNADYPSVGLILRTTLGGLWYWCANQVLVQRSLAAKNISHAKAGCILASYLKLMPMFFMVLPGMISRALYPNEVACADADTCMRVCGSEIGCSNIALPKIVIELMPIGVRGILVAAMIAAVVSSLTSIFNSASAIFTMDIWSNIRPAASPRELLVAGRIFTVVMVGVSIIWIPVMSQAQGGQIFKYATTITGYLGAPTCAMFVLAMFWGRINEEGAFWGMILAQAWGLTRFILEMVYPAPTCHSGLPDDRPKLISGFHAFYHTVSQIVLAFLVATIISFATEAPSKERLAGLTYWTRFEKPQKDIDAEEKRRTLKSLTIEKSVEVEDNGPVFDNGIIENYSEKPNLYKGDIKSGIIEGKSTRKRISISEKEKELKRNHPVTDDNESDSEAEVSLKDRFLQAVCGKSQTGDEDQEDEISESHASRVASIKQPRMLKDLMNVNAVIMLTITIFLYGFFG